MKSCPFEMSDQLNDSLDLLDEAKSSTYPTEAVATPQSPSKVGQPHRDLELPDQATSLTPRKEAPPQSPVCLPGYPRIKFEDTDDVNEFLEEQLTLKDLEKISGWLWILSKQDSKNISPLHRQKVKARDIIVSEDPRLHLVWYHNRIFIKPFPRYLLSHKFWETYLSPNLQRTQGNKISQNEIEELQKAALGLVRTYFYLIKHESDFRIATDPDLHLCLLPPSNSITWESWCRFSRSFHQISDSQVAGRYAYGEIRLTRLNFWSKFLLGKWQFQRVDSQYSDYFARFYGPILFVFGIFSIVLTAMQVELAVEALGARAGGSLTSFWEACRWISFVSLGFLALVVLCLVSLLVFKVVKEWAYALNDRWTAKGGKDRGC